MGKTRFFIVIICFGVLSYSHGQKLDKFESSILEYEQEDKKNGYQKHGILFTGSSSIRMWKSLAEDMAPLPVINRGFGGSTIPEVTYYGDRIIKTYQPKIIVFYCGENDLSNDESKSKLALKSFKQFYKYMKRNLPDTKVFFVSMKPSIRRWNYWPKIQDGNEKISRYLAEIDNYFYVDTASEMLDEDGVVHQDIFVEDNLHMNAKGYKIWTETLKPILEEHYSD